MGRRNDLTLGALTAGYVASLAPSWRRFITATRQPQRAQQGVLKQLLQTCAGSAQARRYELHKVTSFTDFQDRVPIRDYEAYAPDIERTALAVPKVLTHEPVRMLERSSGSSGGTKLIPYTAGLLADFSAATSPWLFSMYARRPHLLHTKSYWSVSPAAQDKAYSKGGLPIGFEDDTEYFGPVARWAIQKILAVPGTVARIFDLQAWQFTTVRHLLACAELGFISVWSPTFLTRLMQGVRAHLQDILPMLEPGRARQIDEGLQAHGEVCGPALWPRLALISCWTDGHAARYVPAVRADFPGVEIQPKGLLATEGVFSFPLSPVRGGPPQGAIAALTSHVLELIDLEHPQRRPLPVHMARPGARYAPLMSTRGGLLRYHLKDAVSCVGMLNAAPLFRFEGKLDRTSDLCGEKLNAKDVERALGHASAHIQTPPHFAMLAPSPDRDPPGYTLYVEGLSTDLCAFADAVEAALRRNYHYNYARDLGQLGPARPVRVRNGQASYEQALMQRGARAGDIKPTPLDKRTFWDEVFEAVD